MSTVMFVLLAIGLVVAAWYLARYLPGKQAKYVEATAADEPEIASSGEPVAPVVPRPEMGVGKLVSYFSRKKHGWRIGRAVALRGHQVVIHFERPDGGYFVRRAIGRVKAVS